MKKTVWTFGLISGAILSAMMAATMPFVDAIGYDRGEVIGYTTMVLASLLIFFGIRSYREQVGGTVSFGRAFAVGALITAISSMCYVATWEVIYYKLTPPGTMEKYQAHAIEKVKAESKSQAAIDKQLADMKKFAELYKNPFINSAITFLEPLPVGLIMTLVSAGILSRKRRENGSMIFARNEGVS
jgi:hypothetical protein